MRCDCGQIVKTAMCGVDRSPFSDQLRATHEWFVSPVTASKRVVDLLQLDTPHKTVVGFKPIMGLQIPLISAWPNEPSAHADRDRRCTVLEHLLDRKPVSGNVTKPQDLWRLL